MRVAAGRGGRPLRAALGVALLVDLVVLGAGIYLLDGVSSTTEVGLDDALVDFRSADADPGSPESEAAGPIPAVPAVGEPAGPSASVSLPEAPAPTTTASAPGPAGPPTVAPTAPFAPPAAGVYRYRTSGGETISLLGARHDYPTETYTVVRHTGGCGWTSRAEVVREHVDEREMCSEAGRVMQLRQGRHVEFFGTTDGGTYVCSPPQVQHAAGDGAGAVSTSECSDGEGSTAHLTRTTLGTAQVTVGGQVVDVVRLRVDGALGGAVRGTSVDLFAIDAATGLPVSWERSLDTVADAFGTTIRYQENARFDLVSLTPTT